MWAQSSLPSLVGPYSSFHSLLPIKLRAEKERKKDRKQSPSSIFKPPLHSTSAHSSGTLARHHHPSQFQTATGCAVGRRSDRWYRRRQRDLLAAAALTLVGVSGNPHPVSGDSIVVCGRDAAEYVGAHPAGLLQHARLQRAARRGSDPGPGGHHLPPVPAPHQQPVPAQPRLHLQPSCRRLHRLWRHLLPARPHFRGRWGDQVGDPSTVTFHPDHCSEGLEVTYRHLD